MGRGWDNYYGEGPGDEPFFQLTCNECGCEWHAGDSDECPSCEAVSISFDVAAAREWNQWVDDHGRAR